MASASSNYPTSYPRNLFNEVEYNSRFYGVSLYKNTVNHDKSEAKLASFNVLSSVFGFASPLGLDGKDYCLNRIFSYLPILGIIPFFEGLEFFMIAIRNNHLIKEERMVDANLLSEESIRYKIQLPLVYKREDIYHAPLSPCQRVLLVAIGILNLIRGLISCCGLGFIFILPDHIVLKYINEPDYERGQQLLWQGIVSGAVLPENVELE